MMELGIHPSEKKVYFGQLLGMCDQITFPLGEWGTWQMCSCPSLTPGVSLSSCWGCEGRMEPGWGLSGQCWLRTVLCCLFPSCVECCDPHMGGCR